MCVWGGGRYTLYGGKRYFEEKKVKSQNLFKVGNHNRLTLGMNTYYNRLIGFIGLIFCSFLCIVFIDDALCLLVIFPFSSNEIC